MSNVNIRMVGQGFWTLYVNGSHVGDFASMQAAERHARKLGWFPQVVRQTNCSAGNGSLFSAPVAGCADMV